MHAPPIRGQGGDSEGFFSLQGRRTVMERVIVAGVDRSARSRVAADWAAHEALLRGCSLHVVHVSPLNGLDAAEQWPYRPEIVADQGLDRVMARHPALRAESVRLTGTASRALHSQSREAEMIVLGLRGEEATPGSPGIDRSGGRRGRRLPGGAGAQRARLRRPGEPTRQGHTRCRRP